MLCLHVSQREQIEKLRGWLREGRAQSASFSDAADAESQFVPIQIEVFRDPGAEK